MAEFHRPIGPHADESEILYIMSLMKNSDFWSEQQETHAERKPIMITADDIKRYLLSRHGISISMEQVQNLVLDGREELSVISMLALLFIPTFAKFAASEEEVQNLETVCPHIIPHVLKTILHDVTGSEEPQLLTEDLVREILLKYNESAPDDLVHDMFLAAKGWQREGNLLFGEETFLNALSNDITAYSVDREINGNTNFADVFGKNQCIDACLQDPFQSEIDESEVNLGRESIQRIETGRGFDFSAGTYYCKQQMLSLFCFFFFSYMGFVYPSLQTLISISVDNCPEYSFNSSWTQNNEPLRCSIKNSIVEWLLLFSAIVVSGFLAIFFGSVGYSIDDTQNLKTLHFKRWCNIVLLIFLIFLPHFFIGFDRSSNIALFLQVLATFFGCWVLFLRLGTELNERFGFIDTTSKLGTFGLAAFHESELKKATAFKVKRMQMNAMKMYSSIDDKSVIKAYYGQILSNYASRADETEEVGSVKWGWKLFMTYDIFTKEGLWISARFLAVNFATMILSIFILFAGIMITKYVSTTWIPHENLQTEVMEQVQWAFSSLADNSIVKSASNSVMNAILNFVEKLFAFLSDANILRLDCIALNSYVLRQCQEASNATLSDFACNLFVDKDRICNLLDKLYRPELSIENSDVSSRLAQGSIFNTTVLGDRILTTISEAASDNLTSQVNKLYPKEKYMVITPAIVATIIAFMASCMLTAAVLPGVMRTIIKLRCGIIPTFENPTFLYNMHYFTISVTYITGIIFWGNLAASILCGLFIGVIVFLCLWQVSIALMAKLLALVIGALIIIIVRWLVSRTCRVKMYSGFYRLKPYQSNLLDLLNTCLNFGISILTVVFRILKILALSFLYVGRFDTPFFANGVSVFSGYGLYFDLDQYYEILVADILMVESHRHNYIETIGAMWLMKLKHRNEFIGLAGNKWREIFAVALMPWLHKYSSGKDLQLSTGQTSKKSLLKRDNNDDSITSQKDLQLSAEHTSKKILRRRNSNDSMISFNSNDSMISFD